MLRLIGSLFVVFGLSLFNPSQADASSFTGRCGGLLQVTNAYDAVIKAQENSIDDDEGVTALISVNFDDRTLSITVDAFNYRNGNSFQSITEYSGIRFSVSDYAIHFGAKKLAFDIPDNDGSISSVVVIALPVNGGNSYLLQSGAGGNFSGVCQKL
jgi:hypothetical protein